MRLAWCPAIKSSIVSSPAAAAAATAAAAAAAAPEVVSWRLLDPRSGVHSTRSVAPACDDAPVRSLAVGSLTCRAVRAGVSSARGGDDGAPPSCAIIAAVRLVGRGME